MSDITRLTGIQGHTLRVWEKRYDFVKADRKSSGFRYYNEDHLKLLINTSILLNDGYRISKISSLSEEEIHEKISAILDQQSPEGNTQLKGLTIAMLNFDQSLFERIYTKSCDQIGVVSTYTNLIFPFLKQIGTYWTFEKADPSQEHFISNLIRQKLISSIDQLPPLEKDVPTLLCFLLEGDEHELGLLLGSYIAQSLGYRVIYLGLRVPPKDLATVIQTTNPKYLFTTSIILNTEAKDAIVETVESNKGISLLYTLHGGQLSPFPATDQFIMLNQPEDMVKILQASKNK